MVDVLHLDGDGLLGSIVGDALDGALLLPDLVVIGAGLVIGEAGERDRTGGVVGAGRHNRAVLVDELELEGVARAVGVLERLAVEHLEGLDLIGDRLHHVGEDWCSLLLCDKGTALVLNLHRHGLLCRVVRDACMCGGLVGFLDLVGVGARRRVVELLDRCGREGDVAVCIVLRRAQDVAVTVGQGEGEQPSLKCAVCELLLERDVGACLLLVHDRTGVRSLLGIGGMGGIGELLDLKVGNGGFNLILARVYRVGILLDLVGAHNHVVGDCGTGGVGSELVLVLAVGNVRGGELDSLQGIAQLVGLLDPKLGEVLLTVSITFRKRDRLAGLGTTVRQRHLLGVLGGVAVGGIGVTQACEVVKHDAVRHRVRGGRLGVHRDLELAGDVLAVLERDCERGVCLLPHNIVVGILDVGHARTGVLDGKRVCVEAVDDGAVGSGL